MLTADARLRRPADFTAVLRHGRRAGRPLLTVHLLVEPGGDPSVRAGLVVSKAVGNSVVRHRTSRRLRALLAGRLSTLDPGTRLVVRASSSAGAAPSRALARDLDAALERLRQPVRPRPARPVGPS